MHLSCYSFVPEHPSPSPRTTSIPDNNNIHNYCALQCKIWLKSNSEQSFLYGNHVTKSGLGRITENTAQYQGVVMYSMNDVPLVSLTFKILL